MTPERATPGMRVRVMEHHRVEERRGLMGKVVSRSRSRWERTPLNAWCELPAEDLSGRCPQTRVGLPTDPEGKGTELLCSIWTPSSPHLTLRSMSSASPAHRKQCQDRRHLSVR